MIYVIAHIEVNEGCREKFLEVFHANVPKVRAEDGCIMYQPTLDYPSGFSKQLRCDKNVVTIVEAWESFDALKAHLAAPHMAAYREATSGMVKDSNLNILEPTI